jgi:cell division protein ZapA (FtsZ GTPase activity inhibitor)
MSVQIVNIELLGVSFAVQTDESVEYIERIVADLRGRVESLRASTRVQDPIKLSIIAGITILDELSRAKEGYGFQADAGPPMRAERPLDAAQGEDELSRVAARLIADLDRSLES